MRTLPTGTVTFLFTDVEGSTRLWEDAPDAMRVAMVRHDAIVDELTDRYGGQVVRPRGEGDSRFCVFARASDGAAAAAAMQRALEAESWPTPRPVRVRAALHTGEADLRDRDYYGTAVNRCARLRAIAHGGQVLVSSATATLARVALADGLMLRDLGQQRLRDLGEPEQVFQLVAPGLPDTFAPLRSLDQVPNNLPIQVTSFVGRECELAEIKSILLGTRLLTLTGIGGAGKTRLALQATADLVDSYPDGAWFVDLAPLADPALVPVAALAALGLGETAGQAPVASLVAYLRDRRTLLLVDNCEHLIEACAHLASALIRGCPGVRLLATSREMLGIPGETAWRVPSLGLPEADAPVDAAALAQFEAVRLFVDRALTAQPAFGVTEQNATALAQVCRRLDGIPLAIELAAARVRMMTVEQIAARLHDRFRLLTGGGRTALRRQQTLQAMVDWSHDLLAENERVLFRRLAVFAGGWTLEAAEAVCGGDPIGPYAVLDLLTGLVDKSLVTAESRGSAERYRLLETLRQYAEDRLLQAGEAEIVRDRHLQWCRMLADVAAPELADGGASEAVVARLRPELENIRAALTWGASGEVGASAGLQIIGTINRQWTRLGGTQSEARRWIETLLPLAPAVTAARCQALLYLNHILRWHYEFELAGEVGAEALEVARELDDEAMVDGATVVMGLVAANQGDYHAALAEVEKGLAGARARGEPATVAHYLRDLGVVALSAGLMERARAAFQESVQQAWHCHRPQLAVQAIFRLAIVAQLEGDHAAARACLDEVDRLGDDVFFEQPLVARANLARAEGRLEDAREGLTSGLRRLCARGEGSGLRDVVAMVGMVEIARGRAARGVTIVAASGVARAGRPLGTIHTPNVRIEGPRFLDAALATLGQAAYDAAWAAGCDRSLDEAIELALGEPDATVP